MTNEVLLSKDKHSARQVIPVMLSVWGIKVVRGPDGRRCANKGAYNGWIPSLLLTHSRACLTILAVACLSPSPINKWKFFDYWYATLNPIRSIVVVIIL